HRGGVVQRNTEGTALQKLLHALMSLREITPRGLVELVRRDQEPREQRREDGEADRGEERSLERPRYDRPGQRRSEREAAEIERHRYREGAAEPVGMRAPLAKGE